MVVAQPAPGSFPVVNVAGGLSVPLGIANAGDGSNRLFVIQQGGVARVARGEALLPTPYFTISAATQCRETPGGAPQPYGFTSGGERGLLGLAFHPSFETNGQLFVSYTDGNGDSLVVRFVAANPAADVLDAADLATCLVLLRVDQDFTNHNGGNLLFDPSGYLTFGLGDGGSGGDPCNRAQTLAPADLIGASSGGLSQDCPADDNFIATGGRPESRALLGKLLRIDVDATTPAGSSGLCSGRSDGSANYAIPTGNPFTGANPACDETYSYGLRNPWRYSFDRSTGDFIVGDVGQDRWEEISLVAGAALAGRNFDW
ncbi:MAG TPA: PQQ-dependent sugar dehydrogenase, partial [Candidatus Saccharimonadia bacterium]|nr:PQQ-dependent sugar dehydrogenase [Candidatus Saccharimonadia bacterium]